MTTVGLLHTSPVHVPVFERLRDEDAAGVALHQIVDESLLAGARADGPASVADAVATAVEKLFAGGADTVLCTCSSIGGLAERAGAALGRPVLRVDRPMAAAAIAAGRRIAVVAALESTVEPTIALLAEEADRAEVTPTVHVVLVTEAWERFEAGDLDGYHQLVALAVADITDVDVIMLAQASMAPVADRVTGHIPVLASPRLGLRTATNPAWGQPHSQATVSP